LDVWRVGAVVPERQTTASVREVAVVVLIPKPRNQSLRARLLQSSSALVVLVGLERVAQPAELQASLRVRLLGP
jgi:hypothetical protein